MPKRNNLILIGMPAVGKSTVGVLLAKQLGLGFMDTDLLIQTGEELSGSSGAAQVAERVHAARLLGTDYEVTLLGNIPPRDVMALGGPEEVEAAVDAALGSIDDRSRLILSCGGGMPPDVTTENVRRFLDRVRQST